MTPGTVIIYLIPLGLPPSTDDDWQSLSPDERVRAGSFVFPAHAARWVACRNALRQILGSLLGVSPSDVPIVISALGKPRLATPHDLLHFSLSHCEDLALLALSADGPVGVDVEPVQRSIELVDCESAFCHPAEIATLPAGTSARGRELLDLWTAKEALLKALGTGFSQAPETLRILTGGTTTTAVSDDPLPGIEGQVIHRLSHPALVRHRSALSAPPSATRIEIRPFETWTSADSSAITAARSASSDG